MLLRKKSRSWRKARAEVFLNILLIFFGILTFFPFVFLIISSLKTNYQFYHFFWIPVHPLHFDTYTAAAAILWRYIVNSAIYCSISILAVCVLSSTSGFVFSRYQFPGKKILFYSIISLIMIPPMVTLITRFLVVRNLGILNTPLAVILPWIATRQVIATWLMSVYFDSLPIELFDAAKIDGASESQTFFEIGLPLAKPMLGTVTIMTLLSTWNDYIWPLVTIRDESLQTLTVGLLSFQGQFLTSWGTLFAGYVIAAIPLIIVFMFTVRYFIAGMTSGAVKF